MYKNTSFMKSHEFKIIVKRLLIISTVVLVAGYFIPQNASMPVVGATNADYHEESYWYYPWGKSVVHKGVDVFAKSGTVINSATKGLVLATGELGMGGKYVLILGPKWRIHYYAHLNSIVIKEGNFVNQNTKIATVGNSGNAKGKPPHLHYAIVTIIPYVWKIDNAKQRWKKMFYLNPIPYISK